MHSGEDSFDLTTDTHTQRGKQLNEVSGPFRIVSNTENVTGYDDNVLYGTILPADHIHAILTHAAAELKKLG